MDLEEFKYAGTNITAFRLVDPDNEDVQVLRTENISIMRRSHRALHIPN